MTSMGKLIVQGGFLSSPINTNHTASITSRTNRIAFPRIFNSSHSLHLSGNTKCKEYHAEAEMNVGSEFKFKRSIRKGDTISLNDLLFTNNRDYLIKNNNQHVKAEQLEGKVIGIYFLPLSAKVPLRHSAWYTTLLKDVYDDLHPVNNFETVLVACNDLDTDFRAEIPIHGSLQSDSEVFQDLFSYMPWTAIPFSDVTSRKHMQRSFGVPEKFIFQPIMYIVDKTGLVLQCDSWEIFDDYGSLGYPFSDKRLKFLRTEDYLASQQPSLKTLLGSPQRDYVISNNGDKVPIDTFEDKVVALYFHQPDDPASVTEELKLTYEEFAMKRKIFEVVLVYIREPCQSYGSDLLFKSEESFWEKFKTMPWLALPFKDMCYKTLKRVFEFKSYGAHKLVIFGPHAEYIEPLGCSMLLQYGIRAFPFTGKSMVEMEIEKLKELNLGKLWNRNNVFRRNDGSQVPFSLLLGKRVMLVLDSFDALKSISDDKSSEERITKSLTILKEKYFLTKGTDNEFEVIRILINNTESLIYKDLVGDMPWLVSPVSDLKYDVVSSRFWYGLDAYFLLYLGLPILAFDQDGRVVRKTLHAELEDMKFPFFAGVIEEKMYSPLSTSREEDYYREVFRYNGRIYRDRRTSTET